MSINTRLFIVDQTDFCIFTNFTKMKLIVCTLIALVVGSPAKENSDDLEAFYGRGGDGYHHGVDDNGYNGRGDCSNPMEDGRLKGIPKIISPDLLHALMTMGHADKIVLADDNFPSATIARSGFRL